MAELTFLEAVRHALLDERSLADDRLEKIRERVKDEVHEAVERADADGYADPAEAHLGVFAEGDDA